MVRIYLGISRSKTLCLITPKLDNFLACGMILGTQAPSVRADREFRTDNAKSAE